jgi:hypothetical protein
MQPGRWKPRPLAREAVPPLERVSSERDKVLAIVPIFHQVAMVAAEGVYGLGPAAHLVGGVAFVRYDGAVPRAPVYDVSATTAVDSVIAIPAGQPVGNAVDQVVMEALGAVLLA